jgi:hypothetical protein
VVHQFGGDARILQVLRDEFGVLLVDLLRGGSGRRRRRFSFPGLAVRGAGGDSESEQRAAHCKAE